MRDDVYSEALLVRYLLGDLTEAEQVEIEDRAFADPQVLESIAAVEADLIDAYARGELTSAARRQFEQRFLASAERRRKVEFAKALVAVTPEFAVIEKPARSAIALSPVTWRTALAALVRGLNPAAKFALAALALLILVGGFWLTRETLRLRAQLRTEQQARERLEQALQEQIAAARTHEDDLAAQLQREQQQREHSEQLLRELERERELKAQESQPAVASLMLLSGAPRSGSARPKLTLQQSTRVVRLQIELEPADEYRSFRVELRDQAGQQVWIQNHLTAQAKRGVRTIGLSLPASVLKAGEYELTLKGVADDRTTAEIGYRYFDVLKK